MSKLGQSALVCALAVLVLAGCSTTPPKQQNNICDIFREKPSWYDDAVDMEEEWGTPIHVAMAFVKQESSFIHDARPPKDYLLGFIPWDVSAALMGMLKLKILLGKTSRRRQARAGLAPASMIR